MTTINKSLALCLAATLLAIVASVPARAENSWAADPAAVEQKFQKALQLAEAEDWQNAAGLLKELHRQWPANREIANNLAVVYFYQGRIDKAQELLAEILESNRETRTSFQNLQMLYGYVTAEAYRQGLGSDRKSKLPPLILKRSLTPPAPPEEAGPLPTGTAEVSTTTSPAVRQTTAKPMAGDKGSTLREVRGRLLDWAAAWSAGDADSYISFYVPDYSPPDSSRKSWLRDRRRKITPARNIRVTLSIQDMLIDDESRTITAIFEQDYAARNYHDTVRKQMIWLLQNGHWRIQEERTIP
jgi:hypothetical protein